MKSLPIDPLDHLDAALRDLVQHERMTQPSPRLRERVMASWAATELHAPANGAAGPQRSRSRLRSVGGVVAASAAATMVVGAIWYTGRQAPSSSSLSVRSPAPVAMPVDAAAAAPSLAPTAPRPTAMVTTRTAPATTRAGRADRVGRAPRSAAVPARGDRGPRQAASEAAAALSASGRPITAVPSDAFVAITPPTGPELGPVQVMRVRFGRGAARMLGVAVPVLSHRGDGSIDADVLVGVDGVARAIRFVP